jgi:hypothetical protein
VFRIAPAQFPAKVWIKTPPEPSQVGGRLNGALVGRQQVNHQGHLAARDSGRLRHTKEVLKTRGHPGRLFARIVDLHSSAPREPEAFGRQLIQQPPFRRGIPGENAPKQSAAGAGLAKFLETSETGAELAESVPYSVVVDRRRTAVTGGKRRARQQQVDFRRIVQKSPDAGLHGLLGQQAGRSLVSVRPVARFFNDETFVQQGGDGVNPLGAPVPLQPLPGFDAIREEFQQPVGADRAGEAHQWTALIGPLFNLDRNQPSGVAHYARWSEDG